MSTERGHMKVWRSRSLKTSARNRTRVSHTYTPSPKHTNNQSKLLNYSKRWYRAWKFIKVWTKMSGRWCSSMRLFSSFQTLLKDFRTHVNPHQKFKLCSPQVNQDSASCSHVLQKSVSTVAFWKLRWEVLNCITIIKPNGNTKNRANTADCIWWSRWCISSCK